MKDLLNMQIFLQEMTELALVHDIIIAEPLEAAPHTYDPQYGPKLYWDVKTNEYVWYTNEGIIRA